MLSSLRYSQGQGSPLKFGKIDRDIPRKRRAGRFKGSWTAQKGKDGKLTAVGRMRARRPLC